MPWFKVDDNLAFHHKVVAAGNPAMGLWVRCGSLCAQQLTDGFVPDHMIATVGTKAQAEKLVAVGLWDRAEGGYRFHEWDARQPSKASVEAERAAAADRMREYRAKKKGTSQNQSAQVSALRSPERAPNEQRTNGELPRSFGNPDPTRPSPDPTLQESGADKPPAARKRAFPHDFEPNEANRRLADERGLDLDAVIAHFRDHHESVGNKFVDWHKALNTWLRREKPAPTGQRAPRHIPLASEIEEPPDGLTPTEYRDWHAAQRAKRHA